MLTTGNLSVIPHIATLVPLLVVTEPCMTLSPVVTELEKEEMHM